MEDREETRVEFFKEHEEISKEGYFRKRYYLITKANLKIQFLNSRIEMAGSV